MSIIEIILPGGFEHFFNEHSDMGGVTAVSAVGLQQLFSRYGLEMNWRACRNWFSDSI